MGLLDRTKMQSSNPMSSTPNSNNAKFGAKKGSYSLSQIGENSAKPSWQQDLTRQNYGSENPAFLSDNHELLKKQAIMNDCVQEEFNLNNVIIESSSINATRKYEPTNKNSFGHETTTAIINITETALPSPPSPELVAELLNNTNTINNVTRILNVNSPNDGITSFIEKTSKLINSSHDEVEFTNDTIFDPNATTAIVNNSHSLIIDGNCNSGSSTSDDDLHNQKLKSYKSTQANAWRLRVFIWFFGIIAAACIISVALYYFVRYGYEQQAYEKIVATDIANDVEKLSSTEVLFGFNSARILEKQRIDEFTDIINRSFLSINKTIEKLDFYLVDANNTKNDSSLFKLLVDITLTNGANKTDSKRLRTFQNTTISASSRLLLTFKRFLKQLVAYKYNSSEVPEIGVMMNDYSNVSRDNKIFTNIMSDLTTQVSSNDVTTSAREFINPNGHGKLQNNKYVLSDLENVNKKVFDSETTVSTRSTTTTTFTTTSTTTTTTTTTSSTTTTSTPDNIKLEDSNVKATTDSILLMQTSISTSSSTTTTPTIVTKMHVINQGVDENLNNDVKKLVETEELNTFETTKNMSVGKDRQGFLNVEPVQTTTTTNSVSTTSSTAKSSSFITTTITTSEITKTNKITTETKEQTTSKTTTATTTTTTGPTTITVATSTATSTTLMSTTSTTTTTTTTTTTVSSTSSTITLTKLITTMIATSHTASPKDIGLLFSETSNKPMSQETTEAFTTSTVVASSPTTTTTTTVTKTLTTVINDDEDINNEDFNIDLSIIKQLETKSEEPTTLTTSSVTTEKTQGSTISTHEQKLISLLNNKQNMNHNKLSNLAKYLLNRVSNKTKHNNGSRMSLSEISQLLDNYYAIKNKTNEITTTKTPEDVVTEASSITATTITQTTSISSTTKFSEIGTDDTETTASQLAVNYLNRNLIKNMRQRKN